MLYSLEDSEMGAERVGQRGGEKGKVLFFLKSCSGSVWRGLVCLDWHGGWQTTGGGGAIIVINKHFNRAGARCQQALGHGPTPGSLAPLLVTLHEGIAANHHLCACVCACV